MWGRACNSGCPTSVQTCRLHRLYTSQVPAWTCACLHCSLCNCARQRSPSVFLPRRQYTARRVVPRTLQRIGSPQKRRCLQERLRYQDSLRKSNLTRTQLLTNICLHGNEGIPQTPGLRTDSVADSVAGRCLTKRSINISQPLSSRPCMLQQLQPEPRHLLHTLGCRCTMCFGRRDALKNCLSFACSKRRRDSRPEPHSPSDAGPDLPSTTDSHLQARRPCASTYPQCNWC